MLPSWSPVTGHVVSKSGLGGVAPGELAESEFVASLHPIAAIEIPAIAGKIPAMDLSFFINAQIAK